MKIEFTNESCTEAIITRGWFRPKWTRVALMNIGVNGVELMRWMFTASMRQVYLVDFWLDHELCKRRDSELRRIANDRDWLDTGKFPRAQLVAGRKL